MKRVYSPICQQCGKTLWHEPCGASHRSEAERIRSLNRPSPSERPRPRGFINRPGDGKNASRG